MSEKDYTEFLIPGFNAKNVNNAIINPLMNAGAQVSKAYGEYGENLRQVLGQEQDDFSKQFLAGKIADKKQQKTGGNITRVGGKTYRMDNPADVKALKAVLAADKASRPGQKFADLRGGGGMTTQTPPVGPPSPSADPRNADYLTARGKLTKDSTAEDIKKVEDIGMTAWAKANPKLAAKVKPGQSGYGVIQGLEKAKDQAEAVSDYKVMGGNEEEGNAIYGGNGGIVEVDIDGSGVGPARISPQGFKDDAMTALLTNFGNTDYEPIVEGLTIPTTTNYAGAFNQADTPDLQSMMSMGDQLGNLGIEGPQFALSEKFKDLFQKSVLGK